MRGFKSAKEAAEAMNIAQATYTQHETRARLIPQKRAIQYAAFFQTTPEWLLYGRTEARPAYVPVVGYLGAGAEAHLFDEDALKDHTPGAPLNSHHTRAILIQSPDLGAMFIGWMALFDDIREAPTPDMDGQLCVVAVCHGGHKQSIYIRKLIRSQTEGRYHLIASAADPLLDQQIVWAARVISLRP
jgi:hypothetical protein